METNVETLLEELGLNQYEVKTYLSLYKTSPQNASTISKDSGVPRGRIYDVLQSLTDKNLVSAQTIKGKANTYMILPPNESLEAYMKTRLQEIDAEKKRVEESYTELTEVLSTIEQIEGSEDDHQPVLIVKGKQAKDTYLRKLFRDAKTSILCNFNNQLIQRYREIIREAADRDIKLTFLLPEHEYRQVEAIIGDQTVYTVAQDKLENQALSILGQVRPPVSIIDEEIGIVFIYDSDDALIIRNRELLRQTVFVLDFFKNIADKQS